MPDLQSERVSTATCNVEVWWYAARINRYITELQKSQSSNINGAIPFDMARTRSYIAAQVKALETIAALPLVDTPETGPTLLPLPAPPTIIYTENDTINLLVQWLEISRDELTNSASARRPCGIEKFDFDRAMSYLGRMAQLCDYQGAVDPLDMPESTPREDVTPAGALGIKEGNLPVSQRVGY